MAQDRQMYHMAATISINGGCKMRLYNVIALLLAQAFGEKRMFNSTFFF